MVYFIIAAMTEKSTTGRDIIFRVKGIKLMFIRSRQFNY